MRDGTSRARENYQRLVSTTMLMRNGEDNGGKKTKQGMRYIYILYIEIFVYFCSVGFFGCTFHTAYPESRVRQICELFTPHSLSGLIFFPTLTRIFPCFRFDAGGVALSGKKSEK